MSDEIYRFIESRLDDIDRATQGMRMPSTDHIRTLTDSMRSVLLLHKNWPILLETEPEWDPPFSADPENFQASTNEYLMRVTQRYQFVTGQEYIKIFGGQPPTTSMLRLLAMNWKQHVDFQPEWALTNEEYLKGIGKI